MDSEVRFTLLLSHVCFAFVYLARVFPVSVYIVLLLWLIIMSPERLGPGGVHARFNCYTSQPRYSAPLSSRARSGHCTINLLE